MNIRHFVALALTFNLVLGVTAGTASAQQQFQHTITGEDLKVLDTAKPEGRDTEGVKQFLATGVNPYVGVDACLPKGEEVYLTSCSGCHGHVGEGKVGPGLADSYWTYPKNKTDKGLFETIYGGGQGMMGPHNDLELDEMLHLMAWIRHLYAGEAKEADWLSDAQKAAFKPYKPEDHSTQGGAEKPAIVACTIPAK